MRTPGLPTYVEKGERGGALKMQDVKMADQVARHGIAEHEHAGHESDEFANIL